MNPLKQLKRKIKFTKQQEERGFDDSTLWELFSNLGEYIYPRIKAFRDMERCGHPTYFSEYHHSEGSKEEYDKAVADGHRCYEVAAGLLTPEQAWKQVLNKIVYAFEYVVFVEGGKTLEESRPFWIHYFGFSPYDEDNECNKYERWSYVNPKNKLHTWAFKDPKIENAKHSVHYGNNELMNYASYCAQVGLDLFAEFFFCLWD
jgi:hypothetical protein